jgi:tRNA modification GTPase
LRVADGQALDRGLAIHFPAPHSYTGEDVLELQAHGGPVLLQLLLARCLQAQPGLRLAEPGEFTQRAFLNDKLDLAQAEAVADLIDASTEAAARSAARSLSRRLFAEVALLAERTVRLRMLVEATLDFPEEEIDFLEQAGARASWTASKPPSAPRWRARARVRCCARACMWCWPGSPTWARVRC